VTKRRESAVEHLAWLLAANNGTAQAGNGLAVRRRIQRAASSSCCFASSFISTAASFTSPAASLTSPAASLTAADASSAASRSCSAGRRSRASSTALRAYSSDRERCFHAMVNSAWRRLLELRVLRQVFTIGQGEAGFGSGFSSCPTRK
jgi:hypothetical protein